jgi:prolyl-tRNA synthetase
VYEFCDMLKKLLSEQYYAEQKIRVYIDKRELNAGEKNWHWIKKGVPVRVEIGPRDIEKNSVMVSRRDKEPQDKLSVEINQLSHSISMILEEIQENLLSSAQNFQQENTKDINSFDEFRAFFTPDNVKNPEIHGGFASCYALDDPEIEEKIKPLKVSARCIPMEQEKTQGKCIFTGKNTDKKIIFAKAY